MITYELAWAEWLRTVPLATTCPVDESTLQLSGRFHTSYCGGWVLSKPNGLVLIPVLSSTFCSALKPVARWCTPRSITKASSPNVTMPSTKMMQNTIRKALRQPLPDDFGLAAPAAAPAAGGGVAPGGGALGGGTTGAAAGGGAAAVGGGGHGRGRPRPEAGRPRGRTAGRPRWEGVWPRAAAPFAGAERPRGSPAVAGPTAALGQPSPAGTTCRRTPTTSPDPATSRSPAALPVRAEGRS